MLHGKEGLVSIIIPAYNSAAYLDASLNSCFRQTYPNIEIIVVDDGSTDNSPEVLKKHIESGQIKYVHQTNKGLSAARNAGIKNASGEFIQFLDADDLLEETKLAKQVEFLKHNPDYLGVYCRWGTFFDNNLDNIIPTTHTKYEGIVQKHLINGNIMPVHSVLIRSNTQLFDEELRSAEDWDYWFKLFDNHAKLGHIEEMLCLVRRHNTNMSNNFERMVSNDLIVLNRIKKHFGNNIIIKMKIEYMKHKWLFALKHGALLKSDKRKIVKAIAFGLFWLKQTVKNIIENVHK